MCTITNTRKTGKLEVVKKDLNPTTDPGRFNLQIDSAPVETRRTSATAARPARRLSTRATTPCGETAGTATTTLADYSKSSIECKADNGTGAVVGPGSGSGPVTVPVTDGSDIVCTITNTRKTGKLEVVKKINPTTDPGRFDLRIDDTRSRRTRPRTTARPARRR